MIFKIVFLNEQPLYAKAHPACSPLGYSKRSECLGGPIQLVGCFDPEGDINI
jgi:hypothetical protein